MVSPPFRLGPQGVVVLCRGREGAPASCPGPHGVTSLCLGPEDAVDVSSVSQGCHGFVSWS